MEDAEKRQRNKESVKEYQKKRDAIMIRPSKEEGETIRAAARTAGVAVQKFIVQAVFEKMDRDAAGGNGKSDSGGDR